MLEYLSKIKQQKELKDFKKRYVYGTYFKIKKIKLNNIQTTNNARIFYDGPTVKEVYASKEV